MKLVMCLKRTSTTVISENSRMIAGILMQTTPTPPGTPEPPPTPPPAPLTDPKASAHLLDWRRTPRTERVKELTPRSPVLAISWLSQVAAGSVRAQALPPIGNRLSAASIADTNSGANESRVRPEYVDSGQVYSSCDLSRPTAPCRRKRFHLPIGAVEESPVSMRNCPILPPWCCNGKARYSIPTEKWLHCAIYRLSKRTTRA